MQAEVVDKTVDDEQGSVIWVRLRMYNRRGASLATATAKIAFPK
jgi:hypothetical protein